MEGFLTFEGAAGLSEFRAKAIATKINAENVEAKYIHYAAVENKPESLARDRIIPILRELLNYGDLSSQDSIEDSYGSVETFYIYPRYGTISPWSSKATSIAHVCGLHNSVLRVERCLKITIKSTSGHYDKALSASLLHDRMTQSWSKNAPDLERMFRQSHPAPIHTIPIHDGAKPASEVLQEANQRLGLALDKAEIGYLVEAYGLTGPLARNPTDVELFMFAQINSEHCRHKQFNASWTIDGVDKPDSLFGMIRNTHRQQPKFTVSAYSDNAAVFAGTTGTFFAPSRLTGEWIQTSEQVPYLGKVETHNHPTSVVPFEGAATGSGGEIRDESAVGRGSRTKAGLCGFAVSDLSIPELFQPWELRDVGFPNHIATSLAIMIDAPLGSAAFNNEFGRPCLTGFFRTLLTKVDTMDGETELRGYHKPIMLAGGIGTVRPQHALKNPALVRPGSKIIVMGGPAMLIGLGGGAASSQTSAEGAKELDFASVQRGNAEVERRAQEVINACTALGSDNPIAFIHDVGAGGLSTSIPELLNDVNLGGDLELRNIDNADRGMSPMQIWCNEAQERYVAAIDPDSLNIFKSIADRERCGYSIIGTAQAGTEKTRRIVLTDREEPHDIPPIDLPLTTLLGGTPKLHRTVQTSQRVLHSFDSSLKTYLPAFKAGVLDEAVARVLQLPAVASKMFLITIGDRTVGGLTCRDQLVGPWQTPVADCAITSTSLTRGLRTGEAMAIGEKPTIALINPAASARMAVAEALMNIAGVDLKDGLERIRLSANWMTAINVPGEAAAIYEAVEAIGMGLCPELGISIPVGKDSTSMKMAWKDSATGQPKSVTAPLSLVVTAFAPVADTRKTWTPALQRPFEEETILLMVDMSEGHRALGGSALAQCFGQIGNVAPDVRNVQLLKDYFDAMEQLHEEGVVLAYHDISDGGLLVSLVEMAIAGRCPVSVMVDSLCTSSSVAELMSALFSEELGGVFQVLKTDEMKFKSCFATCGPPNGLIKKIGSVPRRSKQADPYSLTIYNGGEMVYQSPVYKLHQLWSNTSHQMCKLRDNPACADAEYETISDHSDPGLSYKLTFDPTAEILPFSSRLSNRFSLTAKPRVAILREQGTNGQSEMAFAFMNAGFTAIDVHMTDLVSRESLSTFQGLAICGGFS